MNLVQPDILYISRERFSIVTETCIDGAPDLIVEVLSSSTAYYDLIEKKDNYARFGVKEYWIVGPKKQWMEIYLNVDDEFKLDQRLDKTDIASSQLLQGFEVKLEEIFQ